MVARRRGGADARRRRDPRALARRVLSGVWRGERMDQARAVRVVRRDHDDRRETPEEAEAELRRCGTRRPSGRRRTASRCSRLARIPLHAGGFPLCPSSATCASRRNSGRSSTGSRSAASTCTFPCPIRTPACGRSRASCPDCRASSPPPRTRRSGTARRAVGARSAPRFCSRCRPAGRLRYCGAWDDWQVATRGDSKRRHWDAWPRPEYGTLEVRVLDQPTSVRRDCRARRRGAADRSGGGGVRWAAVRPRRVRGAAESPPGVKVADRRPSASSSSGPRLPSGRSLSRTLG